MLCFVLFFSFVFALGLSSSSSPCKSCVLDSQGDFILLFYFFNWFDLQAFLNLIWVSSFSVPNPATQVFLAVVSAKEHNSWELVVIQ